MHPLLCNIGPLTLHTYGLMVAIGMMGALQYMMVMLRREGIPDNTVMDMALYGTVAGLIGARVAYVLTNVRYYWDAPVEVFKIWAGGLVFYGGLLAGALAVMVYLFRHPTLPKWRIADVFGPALALAHTFGRIGCLFAGCCYGRETTVPWGVTFCDTASLAPVNIARHPTQIYEALGTLSLFVILERHRRNAKHPGSTIGWYLLLYAVLRFCVEFFRGDDRGGFSMGLSPSQWVSVALAVIGLVIVRSRAIAVRRQGNAA